MRSSVTAALGNLPLVPFLIQRPVNPTTPETVLRLRNDEGSFELRAGEMLVDVVHINFHHYARGAASWTFGPSVVGRGDVDPTLCSRTSSSL